MAADPDVAPVRGAGPVAAPDTVPTTEAFLDRIGIRYAVVGRAVVGVLLALAAPFAAPPAGPVVTSVVSLVLIVWSLAYVRLMLNRPSPVHWAADVVLMCALGLAQPALVEPGRLVELLGWVGPLTSFSLIVLQWHVRVVPGAVATLLVTACFVGGAAAAPEVTLGQALAAGGVWMVVEAMLSRLLWHLVRRGGRLAGEAMQARFDEEQEAALASARRNDQRAHWAALHDTSASTLLMVGLGEIRGDEAWLPDQIDRDIAALDGEPLAGGGTVLADALAVVVARSALEVLLRADGLPARVPAPVVAALAGAVGEALENVRRHSGVTRATVAADVLTASGGVRVLVEDTGRGFDPGAVGPGHHGLVLSIRDRLQRAGGRAEVQAAPGEGTRVVLEWPA